MARMEERMDSAQRRVEILLGNLGHAGWVICG